MQPSNNMAINSNDQISMFWSGLKVIRILLDKTKVKLFREEPKIVVANV